MMVLLAQLVRKEVFGVHFLSMDSRIFFKKSFFPPISVSMTNLPEATVCVVGKT